MAQKHVLIIEDERKTADTIALYLEHEGISAVIAADGNAGLKLAQTQSFDLLILDLMLPNLRGEEICTEIRRSSSVPIIMISARGTEQQRIDGLDLGADDYLVKPFSMRELMARVRARLRHTESGPQTLVFDHLEIELGTRNVSLDEQAVSLTSAEFDLLVTLAQRPGQVFTRNQLMLHVFGDDTERYDRTVDTHIKNLRRKIEPDRRQPRFIQTVIGVGYRFNGNVSDS